MLVELGLNAARMEYTCDVVDKKISGVVSSSPASLVLKLIALSMREDL